MGFYFQNVGATARYHKDTNSIICVRSQVDSAKLFPVQLHTISAGEDVVGGYFNTLDPICEFVGLTEKQLSKHRRDALVAFFEKHGLLFDEIKAEQYIYKLPTFPDYDDDPYYEAEEEEASNGSHDNFGLQDSEISVEAFWDDFWADYDAPANDKAISSEAAYDEADYDEVSCFDYYEGPDNDFELEPEEDYSHLGIGYMLHTAKIQRYPLEFLLDLSTKVRNLVKLFTYRNSDRDYKELIENLIKILSFRPDHKMYFVIEDGDYTEWKPKTIEFPEYPGVASILDLSCSIDQKYVLFNYMYEDDFWRVPCGEDEFEQTLNRLNYEVNNAEEVIAAGPQEYVVGSFEPHKEDLVLKHEEYTIAKLLIRIHKEVSPFFVNAHNKVIFKEKSITDASFSGKEELLREILECVDTVLAYEIGSILTEDTVKFKYEQGNILLSCGDLIHNMYLAISSIDYQSYGYYKCINKACNNYRLRTHEHEDRIRKNIKSNTGKYPPEAYCCTRCRGRAQYRKTSMNPNKNRNKDPYKNRRG